MIRSVFTSDQSSRATRPRWVTKASMSLVGAERHRKGRVSGNRAFARRASIQEFADVREVAGDRRRRRHRGADEVGAASGTLAALEIAVRGAGRALAGGELVGVHGQAHAASGLPPLGP